MTITERSFNIGIVRTKDFDKQQRIKDAMVDLILKEGINGASVSKIAKEAGVSPATIYVYYENKEDMLSEVFDEYVRKTYSYVSKNIYPQMAGEQFIETLVRSTYRYALENENAFSFVEQCSCCPTLQESSCHSECSITVFDMIHDYQDKGIIRKYSDLNIAAFLFEPVKFMAMTRRSITDPERELDELIGMLQKLLLY